MEALGGVVEKAKQLRIAPYGTWRYACGTYTIARGEDGPTFKEVCSVGLVTPQHTSDAYVWKAELSNSGNVLEFILTRGSQQLLTVFAGAGGSGKRIKHAAVLAEEKQTDFQLRETFKKWEEHIRSIIDIGMTAEPGHAPSFEKAIVEVFSWVDEFNDIWNILFDKGNEVFDGFMMGVSKIGLQAIRRPKSGNSTVVKIATCLQQAVLQRRAFARGRADVAAVVDKFCNFFESQPEEHAPIQERIPSFVAAADPTFQDWITFCSAREQEMQQCKDSGDANALLDWYEEGLDTAKFDFAMPTESELTVEKMREQVRKRRFAMLGQVEEWEKKVALQMDQSSPSRLKEMAKAFQELRLKEEGNLSAASDRYEAVVTPSKIKAVGGIKNMLVEAGVKGIQGMDEERLENEYARLKLDLFRARELAGHTAARSLTPSTNSVQQLAKALEANSMIQTIAEKALPELLREEQSTVDEQSTIKVVENQLMGKLNELQKQTKSCRELEDAATKEETAAEEQLRNASKQFQEAVQAYEQKNIKASVVRILNARLGQSQRELEQRLRKVQTAVGDFCNECGSWAAAARAAHDTLQAKIKELVADSEAMMPLPVQAAIANCTCACELLDKLAQDKEQEEECWHQKIQYIDARCEVLEGEMESGSSRRTFDQLSTELAKCMDKGKELKNKLEACHQHRATFQAQRMKASSQMNSLASFGLAVEEEDVWKRATKFVEGAYRGRTLFHPSSAGTQVDDRFTMQDLKVFADNPQVQELFSKMVWEQATRLFEQWCADSCDTPLLRETTDVMSEIGSVGSGWLMCDKDLAADGGSSSLLDSCQHSD